MDFAPPLLLFGRGCQNQWELVGEFTTHFRTYFSGDAHWGYGLDPWPCFSLNYPWLWVNVWLFILRVPMLRVQAHV